MLSGGGIAAPALVLSALALTACAGPATRSREPAAPEPALVPLGPSELEREMGFERRLAALRAATEGESAIAAPEGCAVVASGSRFVICRRGRAHHVFAHRPLGSQGILVRSHPRMRATRRQAEDMVCAMQLMHLRR